MDLNFKFWVETDNLPRDLFGDIDYSRVPGYKKPRRKPALKPAVVPGVALARRHGGIPDPDEIRLLGDEPKAAGPVPRPSDKPMTPRERAETFHPRGPLSDRLRWIQDMERIAEIPFVIRCIQLLFSRGQYPPGVNAGEYQQSAMKAMDEPQVDRRDRILAVAAVRAREMLAGGGVQEYDDDVVQRLLNRLIVDRVAALDLDEARLLFRLVNKFTGEGGTPWVTDEVVRAMHTRLGDPVR